MADATLALVDALTAHGRKVRAHGPDSFLAQCPSHEDREASLSISRGRGQALLYCHAGCDWRDILDAVGLPQNGLFDDPKGVDYEYRHRGRVVRTVHRSPEKKFFQRIDDASVVPLYEPPGMPPLEQAISEQQRIWIPEGEKDADTLVLLARQYAVTSPMGAANWAKADWSSLAEATDLAIIADDDEAGLARARDLRAHLLTITQASIRVYQAAIGKDVTDHLVAGKDLDELVELQADPEYEAEVQAAMRQLRIRDDAARRYADQALSGLASTFAPLTLREALAIEDPEPEWIVPDYIEQRDRFMLTGHEGHGKSKLLIQMGVCIAAGAHPFRMMEQIEPRRVLVIDAENTPDQWTRSARYIAGRASALGAADPRDNLVLQAGARLDLTTDRHVKLVHRWLDEYEAEVLVIGPLYKLVPKEITNDTDAAPLIMALDRIRERGVTLLMEAHAGKSKEIGGERSLAPRGSSALLGWPEYGIGLRPVEDDPTMAALVRWRGDRSRRSWPAHIRHGVEGEYPWMPSEF